MKKITNLKFKLSFLILALMSLFNSTTFSQTATSVNSSGNWITTGAALSGATGATLTVGKAYLNGSYPIGGDVTITTGSGYSSGKIYLNASTSTQGLSATSLSVSGSSYVNGIMTIGTLTSRPGCQLTVNGKIAAEEFEIITDVAVPDYVFESNYKLRSLKELEEFIKEYKHLPEAKSATQIKQDGYKVVEMDNLLLKKVEELSLYVIELNKKLEATEAELAKLKAMNNQ